jgi:hypothetical protein
MLMSHLTVFGGNQRDMVGQSISLQHKLDTSDDGSRVNTKKIAQCCARVAPTKSICA